MNSIAMFTLDLIRALKPKLRGWHLQPLAAVDQTPPIRAYRIPKNTSAADFFVGKAVGDLAYVLCRRPRSRLRILSIMIKDGQVELHGKLFDGNSRCLIRYYAVNGWRQNEFRNTSQVSYKKAFYKEYDPDLVYYSSTPIYHFELGRTKRDRTCRIVPMIDFAEPNAVEKVVPIIAQVLLKSFEHKDPRTKLIDFDDRPLAVFLDSRNRLLNDIHSLRLDVRLL